MIHFVSLAVSMLCHHIYMSCYVCCCICQGSAVLNKGQNSVLHCDCLNWKIFFAFVLSFNSTICCVFSLKGQLLLEVMSKYWILVCTGMLLFISIQGIVIYRTIYMILFFIFILTFQVDFESIVFLYAAYLFITHVYHYLVDGIFV